MPHTELSRRDEFALRLAEGLLSGDVKIKKNDSKTELMGVKSMCLYAVELADAMIAKLDEVKYENLP